MGDYTGLRGTFKLKTDTPPEVVHTLMWMCNGGRQDELIHELPQHEAFEKWRVPWMFGGTGAYLEPEFEPASSLTIARGGPDHGFTLRVCFNIKNYESEIESFLDWIEPYVAELHGGAYQYEYWDRPVSVTLEDGKIRIYKEGATLEY